MRRPCWIYRCAPTIASCARRPGRNDDDLAAVLFLEPQRLLERVRVRLVQLPARVLITDPGLRVVDADLPLTGDDLFDADGDFHGFFAD